MQIGDGPPWSSLFDCKRALGTYNTRDMNLAPPVLLASLFSISGKSETLFNPMITVAHFELFPSLQWTMAAVALSALLWVLLRAKGWGAAAGWAALACAGQACMLQLFDVGTRVRPQVFYGWSELLPSWRAVFLLALGVQALVVTWGVWRHLRPGLAAVRRAIPFPALLAVLAVMAYASATIAPEVAQAFVNGGFVPRLAMHVSKIALGMMMLLVGAVNLALAAATLPDEALEELKMRWRARNTSRLPRMVALWVVAVASLLAWVVLERMPHMPDEVAYIFQAKYLAAGKLYLPMPPDAKALYMDFTIADGTKWYCAVPLGWPLVLAVGMWLGVPWLVNPLLGGLVILLAHALVRRLYDRDIADATALLLGASPWLLFMSANFMAHTASLALGLLGLLGVARAREEGSVGGAALAGLAFGGLLHIRPLEAVIVASVAGLWWLAGGWKKLRIAALAVTLAAGGGMTALLLAYNKMLTGSATKLPLELWTDVNYYPGANRLGFGKEVGNFGWTGLDALQGHGPIDVVMNTNHNLYMLNFEMFGWMCGSLLFVLLLPFLRRSRSHGLMWGLVAGTWAGLSLYWFSGGPDFGARYWYQMFVPLVALTVLGAREYAAAMGKDSAKASAGVGGRVWVFVLLASVIGTINLLPWRALDKYYNYRGMRSDVRALLRENDFGKSLVLVRGKPWPDYAATTPFNPATFDREYPGPIFVHDVDPASTNRVQKYFSDRPIWILAGPSQTGDKYRIVEQPSRK
jgi:hypothetical protein